MILSNLIMLCFGLVLYFMKFFFWAFWIFRLVFLSNFENSSYYSFKYLFAPPPLSETPVACVLNCLKLSHSSLIFFLFFNYFFSVYVSLWIISTAPPSCLLTSSVMSHLILIPFGVFFILHTVVSISRDSIKVFSVSFMSPVNYLNIHNTTF